MTSGPRKKPVRKASTVEREVQVRMEDGQLRFFQNYSEAWSFFLHQPRAWKISWTFPAKLGGGRLRIVKLSDETEQIVLGAGFMEDFITVVEQGHKVYTD